MRIFLLAFAGKLVATLFVAICIALGFGPSEWAKVILGIEPTLIARVIFGALGVITAVALLGPVVRSKFRPNKTDGENIQPLSAARRAAIPYDTWKGLDQIDLETAAAIWAGTRDEADVDRHLKFRALKQAVRKDELRALKKIGGKVNRFTTVAPKDLAAFLNSSTAERRFESERRPKAVSPSLIWVPVTVVAIIIATATFWFSTTPRSKPNEWALTNQRQISLVAALSKEPERFIFRIVTAPGWADTDRFADELAAFVNKQPGWGASVFEKQSPFHSDTDSGIKVMIGRRDIDAWSVPQAAALKRVFEASGFGPVLPAFDVRMPEGRAGIVIGRFK